MRIPQKGFYVHYKHDPAGPAHNHHYEVVGLGRNTEDKTYIILYRPLYTNDWMPPADLQARPLEMFMEEVEKDGVKVPRFIRITDPSLITELEAVRRAMYP